MNPEPIKSLISTSDIDQIDVGVGTNLAVEDVAHSEKLVRLRVDFGDHARSILIGLKKERPSPKEIESRQAPLIVNLAPRKVAGEISEGLLFDAGYADERSRFRTAPAQAEGPVEGLLSFAKLPRKNDGEAPGEPGAATCSAESGPSMLT
ncbi:hypothetical protein [Bradyrhizobium sp. NAS80.1]|uniref:hypothetical protein n=1 Tax=Bradyrhizobium sp. NAS80.1 TaxID=1680159 RepID=UPI00143DEC58|nr:hypothetical protein [Bradyrhizobium sp. NAS80.1]